MENVMRIKAEPREGVGKQLAKRLRRQGKIPAIIYGERKESLPISIELDDVKAVLKAEKGENTVLKIYQDKIEVDAMLKEIQYDYLSDHIIHADFLRLDLSKPVTAWVPISIKGECIGVKLEDGIFDFVTREIQIKCLAMNIPKEIIVNVTNLHAGSSIKAGDLDIGEGIQLVSGSHRVICSVTSSINAGEEKAGAETGGAPQAKGGGEKGQAETKSTGKK